MRSHVAATYGQTQGTPYEEDCLDVRGSLEQVTVSKAVAET